MLLIERNVTLPCFIPMTFAIRSCTASIGSENLRGGKGVKKLLLLPIVVPIALTFGNEYLIIHFRGNV
jgi:hypothetical protein